MGVVVFKLDPFKLLSFSFSLTFLFPTFCRSSIFLFPHCLLFVVLLFYDSTLRFSSYCLFSVVPPFLLLSRSPSARRYYASDLRFFTFCLYLSRPFLSYLSVYPVPFYLSFSYSPVLILPLWLSLSPLSASLSLLVFSFFLSFALFPPPLSCITPRPRALCLSYLIVFLFILQTIVCNYNLK